jgi:hypothetical protein
MYNDIVPTLGQLTNVYHDSSMPSLLPRTMCIAAVTLMLTAGCSDSTGTDRRPGEASVTVTDVNGGPPHSLNVSGDLEYMPHLVSAPNEGARAFRSWYTLAPHGVLDSAVFVMAGVRPAGVAPGNAGLMDVFGLDIPIRFVSVGVHKFTCQPDSSCIRPVLTLGQSVDSLGKLPVVFVYPANSTETELTLDEVSNDRIRGSVRQAVIIAGSGTNPSTGILTAMFDVPMVKRPAECISVNRC